MKAKKQFLSLKWITILVVIALAIGCSNEGEITSSEDACAAEAIHLKQTIDSLMKYPKIDPDFMREKNYPPDDLSLSSLRAWVNFLLDERQKSIDNLNKIAEYELTSELENNSAVYRLMYVEPHVPRFLNIYVARKGDTSITLTSKIIGTQRDPGTNNNTIDTLYIVNEAIQPLNSATWYTLESLIDDAYFWDITRNLTEEQHVIYGGSTWILEGAHAGNPGHRFPAYNLVSRTSPNDNSFKKACEYIMGIAGGEN